MREKDVMTLSFSKEIWVTHTCIHHKLRIAVCPPRIDINTGVQRGLVWLLVG